MATCLFDGFGNLRLPRTAVQGITSSSANRCDFQDALAGFGIRYALRSGYLAVRVVLEGANYTLLRYRRALRARICDHNDCRCVWYACQAEMSEAS